MMWCTQTKRMDLAVPIEMQRGGSFAMLMFAMVSLVSGALLPYLALAGEKAAERQQGSRGGSSDDSPTPPSPLDIPADQESLHTSTAEEPDDLSRAQRIVRGLTHGLTLRTFWTLASVTFAALMLVGTSWAATVHEATIVIALVGMPWSIAAWAPFAMVGEFVREAEDGASPFEFEEDHWSPTRTRARRQEGWLRKQRRESLKYIDASPTRSCMQGEQGARERIRASLVDCEPLPDTESIEGDGEEERAGGAGTILGIHNLAIVAPQFVVAIIASLIFRAVHARNGIHLVLGPEVVTALEDGAAQIGNPAEGTIWVLRFGGAMALLAAAATRLVPLTLSERRRRYATARVSGVEAPVANEDDDAL